MAINLPIRPVMNQRWISPLSIVAAIEVVTVLLIIVSSNNTNNFYKFYIFVGLIAGFVLLGFDQ